LTLSVWRIASTKNLTLDTLWIGSTLAAGRWHPMPPVGKPVVYAGSSRSICQLEKRVHCNGIAPKNQALMRLDLPDGAALDASVMSDLPADWVKNQALTQAIGLQWRDRGQTLGLWVPSTVEPGDLNLVINPDHPQYRHIAVHVERNPFEFDPRMFN